MKTVSDLFAESHDLEWNHESEPFLRHATQGANTWTELQMCLCIYDSIKYKDVTAC